MTHHSGQATPDAGIETPRSASGGNETPIHNDNPADAAVEIVATLDQNEAVSPVSKQTKPDTPGSPGSPGSSDTPAWRKEPIANFKLDADGKVITRRNGKPVRRGGKPAKARPGDVLADGTTYGVEGTPEQVSVSRVVVPGEGVPGGGGGGESPGADQGGRNGPAFGRLLARLGFAAAQKRGGEKWKPDDDENELIGEAASETFGNRHVPWWLVLPIAVTVYVVARIEFTKREVGKIGDHTHMPDRANDERKNTDGTPAQPGAVW